MVFLHCELLKHTLRFPSSLVQESQECCYVNSSAQKQICKRVLLSAGSPGRLQVSAFPGGFSEQHPPVWTVWHLYFPVQVPSLPVHLEIGKKMHSLCLCQGAMLIFIFCHTFSRNTKSVHYLITVEGKQLNSLQK